MSSHAVCKRSSMMAETGRAPTGSPDVELVVLNAALSDDSEASAGEENKSAPSTLPLPPRNSESESTPGGPPPASTCAPAKAVPPDAGGAEQQPKSESSPHFQTELLTTGSTQTKCALILAAPLAAPATTRSSTGGADRQPEPEVAEAAITAGSGGLPQARTSSAGNEAEGGLLQGWRLPRGAPSLSELYGSVRTVPGARWFQQMISHCGPAWLIGVGYMDPGNWVGDIAGGSAFGYSLLWVVLLSSVVALYLQALAARLGVVTRRDLAQACRDAYPRWAVVMLWVSAEIAIAATDLAEVIGSAIALNLLFGLPTIAGVCVTAADVLVVLALKGRSARYLEALISLLIGFICICIVVLMGFAQPEARDVMSGFLPSGGVFTDSTQLLVAVSIIGATVMPHNLYLHSSLVMTRASAVAEQRSVTAEAAILRYTVVDSAVALALAFVANAGLLILGAATFYVSGNTTIATLQDAYALLEPLLGSRAAPILFGAALLAAGQISTLTGTLAGQVVMEGFMTWRMPPYARRLVTRLVAVIPAIAAVAIGGDAQLNNLLLVSQVVLSFQLPLAVFPLMAFTTDRSKLGVHALSRCNTVTGWSVFAVVLVLNVLLIVTSVYTPT